MRMHLDHTRANLKKKGYQEDFKIEISNSLENQNWKTFIAPKNEVLIGGCTFLKNWIIRSETSNALDKLFVRNISNNWHLCVFLSMR